MVGGPQATAANLTPLGPRRRLVSSVYTAPVAPMVSSVELELVDVVSAHGMLVSPPSTTATHKNDDTDEQQELADTYENPSRRLLRRYTAARTSPPPISDSAVDAQCFGPKASAANLVPLGLACREPVETVEATTPLGQLAPPLPRAPPVQVDTQRHHRQRSRSPPLVHFERPFHRDRDYHQRVQPYDAHDEVRSAHPYDTPHRRDNLRRERSQSSHRYRGRGPSPSPPVYRYEEHGTRDHEHTYQPQKGRHPNDLDQLHQEDPDYGRHNRSLSPLDRGRESPRHYNGYSMYSRRRSPSPNRRGFDQPRYLSRNNDHGRRAHWHGDRYFPRRGRGRY